MIGCHDLSDLYDILIDRISALHLGDPYQFSHENLFVVLVGDYGNDVILRDILQFDPI